MRKAIIAVWLVCACTVALRAQKEFSEIGEWETDRQGLPAFRYTGTLPYRATLDNGDSVKVDPDPWFVLGNAQLTLFTHVSGQLELISGQRAWARLNQGDRINTGANEAFLQLLDKEGEPTETLRLTGMESLAAHPELCRRTFGCGYARYDYLTKPVEVSRTLGVRPSQQVGGGASAFLLTVAVCNRSSRTQRIRYVERIRARYETMMQQLMPSQWKKVKYRPAIEAQNARVVARFSALTDDPMLFQSKDDLSKYEGFPPVLFVEDLSGKGRPSCTADDLGYAYELTLRPGERREVRMIVGYSMERSYSNIGQIHDELTRPGSFAEEWRQLLPRYDEESDAELGRELTWHAHMLEAMSTYSDYYHETKIPQGTIYDYYWGQHASARDNFQHALPTIYYRPELTKSIIRYMMKRTLPSGDVMLIEYGNGYAEPTCYQTSDQQLWFFLLLSEYLRITGDYAFLNEKVPCYPVKEMPEYTILEHATHCFDYLRNQVGTGSHGLVRLLNSDWCDGIFYTIAAPYNVVQPQGESHMNTAMALTILPVLADQLERAQADSRLVESMRQWRQQLYEAYMRDWGDRAFPRRMYFAGRQFGEDNLFLEHLGFTLQMRDVPEARRRALYGEMQQRLYVGEKLGAREQERPELTSDDLDYGSRENGGFWYSLNGPVIVGVNTFDSTEAMRLLKQMSLANAARQFPHYWTAYWSAADNIESSLVRSEGLPDQTASYSETAIACAHVHAWMLYLYHRLKEGEGK